MPGRKQPEMMRCALQVVEIVQLPREHQRPCQRLAGVVVHSPGVDQRDAKLHAIPFRGACRRPRQFVPAPCRPTRTPPGIPAPRSPGEIRCRCRKRDAQGNVAAGGKRPGQRGAEVIDFNAIAPKVIDGGLSRPRSQRGQQPQIEFRMLSRHLLGFAAVSKLLECVGSCGLQQ